MKSVARKLSGRVFGVGGGVGGGNPVSIYLSPPRETIPSIVQQRLAQENQWESVVVEPNHHLSFFMPSGEEVSFCAHAAMGAAWALVDDNDKNSSSSKNEEIQFQTKALPTQTARVDKAAQTVWLQLESVYSDSPVHHDDDDDNDSAIKSILKQIRVDPDPQWLIRNASVARPKTLIRLESEEAVHAAQPPTDPDLFRESCDRIGSTGIYLYAPKATNNNNSYECRQFPRASGYPEDPATGIAAAALAWHLKQQPGEEDQSVYRIYQGTAMKRPSLIQVQNLKTQGTTVTFEVGGRVEIDSEEDVELYPPAG